MTTTVKKTKLDLLILVVITLCVLGGVGLCVSALSVPNWRAATWTEGIVITTARLGLLTEELCDYRGCRTYWYTQEGFDINVQATFEQRDTIRELELVGAFISIISLALLIPLWMSKSLSQREHWVKRTVIQFSFFLVTLSSSLIIGSGPLLMQAHSKSTNPDWAPILAGCSSGLLLSAAFFSAIFCRHDTRRAGVEKATPPPKAPIVPGLDYLGVEDKKTAPLDMDKIAFVGYDYNCYSYYNHNYCDSSPVVVEEKKVAP